MVLSGGASTTVGTAIDLSSLVPPVATGEWRSVDLLFEASNSSGGQLYVYSTDGSDQHGPSLSSSLLAGVITGIPMDDADDIAYHMSASGGSSSLWVSSYGDWI